MFANAYQRGKALSDAFYFFQVLGVGIFYLFKFFLVYIIAGVYTHFLYNAGGYFGSIGGEMDIGHQRHAVATAVQFVFDGLQVFGFFFAGGGDAHQLGTRLNAADALLHGAQGIHGVGGGHGLHPNGVVVAQQQATNVYFFGCQAFIAG